MTEEVAQILGVPFQVIPFKQSEGGAPTIKVERHHVHAIPERAALEIRFPRVEGYWQAVRNRIRVIWEEVPSLTLDPLNIPPEVEMKAGLPANDGRPMLFGPGKISEITLNPYRVERRLQEMVFEMARDLTRLYREQPECEAPSHILFPQLARIVGRFVEERIRPVRPATRIDAFMAPYYGWMLERILAAIRPDEEAGESAELPRLERSRGEGSTADVDFWTGREVREVRKSHVNYIVADTRKWEQNAAYRIDRHPKVAAFVKNAGLGFAIPYFHNAEPRDYLPDFIIRLNGENTRLVILETKGFDPLEEVKRQAAERWVNAVNTDGHFGTWSYALVKSLEAVDEILDFGAG
jgi:type III restriction enzyme